MNKAKQSKEDVWLRFEFTKLVSHVISVVKKMEEALDAVEAKAEEAAKRRMMGDACHHYVSMAAE